MGVQDLVTPDLTPAELAEIERLALAGDPDAPPPADAVPWRPDLDDGDGLLPDWYMPTPSAPVRGWRRVVA